MKNKIFTVLFWSVLGLFFLLATIVQSACNWFNMRFTVSFEEILFTITSPLNGSDVSFLNEAIDYILPSLKNALILIVVFTVFVILLRMIRFSGAVMK